jgi:hypothetical protein
VFAWTVQVKAPGILRSRGFGVPCVSIVYLVLTAMCALLQF